jgi:hypothetical protein
MTQYTFPGIKTMATRPRLKTLAACIGVAIAQWGTGTAYADSAVGVDMANGNAMNPPGRSAMPRSLAEDGADTVLRSPTGQLYGLPSDVNGEVNKTAGGWEYKGGIEVGVVGGDANTKDASFRKYKDLKNGASLNYFVVEGDKPDTASYASAFGGGTGQSDQFYGVQIGRYNDWKLKLFYNETLHVFSDNWKSLFSGEGTGNLTMAGANYKAVPITSAAQATQLGFTQTTNGNTNTGTTAAPVWSTALSTCTAAAPCWYYKPATGAAQLYSNGAALAGINGVTGNIPGVVGNGTATSNTVVNKAQGGQALAIANYLATVPDSELSLVRKKAGARYDVTLSDNWKGYASYSREQRTGARPFAMNEGNISTEIAEPINYLTHEFLAGLQYADKLTQANVRVMASVFKNNIDTLNVQYPLLNAITPNAAMGMATYDLYPDNSAYNVKGEFARSLPDFFKGRFNAAVSVGSSLQDDALQAPISPAQSAQLAATGVTTFGTAAANSGYAAGSALVSNWNTTAALSQQSAKQRIDTRLLDLGLSIRPSDDLSVKASYRNHNADNKGGYTAYNPLTGQFGRGPADGNGGGLDLIVGLQPGATPGKAGSCYILPGFSANALTGTCQFGLAGAVANGSNVPVFAQARSTRQINYGVTADYDLTRTSSVNGAVEREEFNRTFRERDQTWENKVKIGYVNRALGDTTLRTSLETTSKRGSDYNYRTFADLGTGLPGLDPATQIAMAGTLGYTAFSPVGGAVANNANLFNRYSYYFRKYDQADRDLNIFNARLNILASEDFDIGAVIQAKDVKYPDSFYGLESDKLNSLTLDLNYQPASGTNITAFYSYQRGTKFMSLNSGAALSPLVNTCTAANLSTYGYSACSDNVNGVGGTRPLSAAWSMNTEDNNNMFGIGFQTAVGSIKLGVDYTYMNSSTNVDYTFGSTAISGVAATQQAQALIAGSALPSMTYTQQTLNFNALIPLSKKLTLRLFDRLEIGQVKDWHYDGVLTGAMANYDSGTLLLDAGAQNYRANVIGIILQYKL